MSQEAMVCERCGAHDSPFALKCKKYEGSLTLVRDVPVPSRQEAKTAQPSPTTASTHTTVTSEQSPARVQEAQLAELSEQGRLLYQLIEVQSRALAEQEMQGRMITLIGRWVTAFGIVWLLGMVLGCVWALLGSVSLLSLFS
jgi:hypothetical protein